MYFTVKFLLGVIAQQFVFFLARCLSHAYISLYNLVSAHSTYQKIIKKKCVRFCILTYSHFALLQVILIHFIRVMALTQNPKNLLVTHQPTFIHQVWSITQVWSVKKMFQLGNLKNKLWIWIKFFKIKMEVHQIQTYVPCLCQSDLNTLCMLITLNIYYNFSCGIVATFCDKCSESMALTDVNLSA